MTLTEIRELMEAFNAAGVDLDGDEAIFLSGFGISPKEIRFHDYSGSDVLEAYRRGYERGQEDAS